jgi:hypothetical protein
VGQEHGEYCKVKTAWYNLSLKIAAMNPNVLFVPLAPHPILARILA